MPRKPGMPEPMVERLSQGTRFAPSATLRRAIERAEALARELDPEAVYPEDFLTFRLLAYRLDSPNVGTATGRAILASLPGLIDRWSSQARFTLEELAQAGGVEAAELADRWRVSRKTLARWARFGLVPRRARDERGAARAVYMPDVIAGFRAEHTGELARAAAFSRISGADSDSIIRRARTYQRRLGWTQTRAARRIAERFGRSAEAIRQVLSRSESQSPHKRSPDERSRRLMYRATRLGFDPAVLASRFGCSRAACQRGINLVRLRHLRAYVQGRAAILDPMAWSRHPALSHAVVRTNLSSPGITDLAGFFEAARDRTPAQPREERLLLEGLAALRGAAAAIVGAISPLNPEAEALDAAETLLRWASRVKAELMRRQLALLVETADSAFGVPVESLPAARADEARASMLAALATSLDHLDPATAGRIAAPAGLAMATAAARLARLVAPLRPRALSRLPAGIDIPDWTTRVDAWQLKLEPDSRVRPNLVRLRDEQLAVATARWGYGGNRPLTLSETALTLGIARVSVPAIERLAIRTALAAARGLCTARRVSDRL